MKPNLEHFDWLEGFRRQATIHGDAVWNGVSHLPSIRDQRIIDLGCGTGEMSAHFSGAGGIVYLLDVDFELLKKAKERLKTEGRGPYFVINGRSESIPVASESIDIVFSRSTLQYTDIDQALREINRILKPEGALILCENLANNPLIKLYRTHRQLKSVWSGDRQYVDTIKQYLSPDNLRAIQRDFRIINVKYYHILRPFTLYPLMFGRQDKWLVWLDRHLNSFDIYLLSKMPSFSKFAWIISIVAFKEGK